MAKAIVTAGICGFTSTIEASPNGAGPFRVHLHVESECPDVQNLAAEIQEVDAMAECLGRGAGGASPVVLEAGRRCLRHLACPVPVAIIKAIEVAAGLALPKDVSITITRE